MNAHSQSLPERVADPLTINFLKQILDVKKPNSVVLTGDQLHHEIRALRKARLEGMKEGTDRFPPHLSLAFVHIPLPEYADSSNLVMTGGHRREPTEGPSFNSRFYDVLAAEGVAASDQHEESDLRPKDPTMAGGPRLCHAGGVGFGGYSGCIKTWKRVEYAEEKVDEVMLVNGDAVVVPPPAEDDADESTASVSAAQAVL
ncbi:hypothetical protein LTR37_005869 [Vermiconidia calcicola]|uniref:Uncharacterized protein n=1 Tax=Vermiconidia calcicola TaxID=1690605 RepID=A0ACC3NJL5_9PEZI|nr:hypothetical protein LTR37_005869 [Vermiconidia calcicola]